MKVEKEKAGGLERNQGNCFPMGPSFFFPPLDICLYATAFKLYPKHSESQF